MNFCRNCGHKLNQGAKFCPSCGKELLKDDKGMTGTQPQQSQFSEQPPQQTQYSQKTPPPQPARNTQQLNNKKKSGAGKFIAFVLAFVFVTGVAFLVYNLFIKGGSDMKAEYKVPSEKLLVKLDSSGMAPANMFGIMMKEGYGKGDAEDAAELVNGKIVGEIEINNVYQVEFDGKTKEDLYSAIEKVKKSDKVDEAFVDGIFVMDGAENMSCNPFDDPFYEGKDGNPYRMINLKQAWDIIRASGIKLSKVKVGVVDTDINYDSDELNSGKVKIEALEEKDRNKNKQLTHGGMTTGMIGGNEDNGGEFGTASVLGENLQIYTTSGISIDPEILNKDKKDEKNLYEYEENGTIYSFEAMKNIQKQIDKGATIINCSFGNKWNQYTPAQHRAFSRVYKSFLERVEKKYPNVIIVSSAGNDGRVVQGTRIWSHKTDNLVTVGAVNRDGTWADYSNVAKKNTDDEVTVVVCGQNKMEDGKDHFGTSFAAPQVTGIIALLRSVNPNLTPAQIKKILTETSKSVEEKDEDMKVYNQQLVQADDAVLKAIEMATGKKFDKNKLLAMMKVELKSDGASPEFKIEATVESVGESGTTLSIECNGGNYALGGDKTKKLSSAGSVSWSLTIPDPETIISVTVTRMDTKACKTILVGGKIEAKDLVGTWTGGTCWDAWSTPYKIAEPGIKANLKLAKGEFKTMTMNMTLVSENSLQSVMDAGGYSNPLITFSFNDGNLEGTGSDGYNKYHFSGTVKSEGGMYQITGEWNSTNQAMKMNGRWKASKKVGS